MAAATFLHCHPSMRDCSEGCWFPVVNSGQVILGITVTTLGCFTPSEGQSKARPGSRNELLPPRQVLAGNSWGFKSLHSLTFTRLYKETQNRAAPFEIGKKKKSEKKRRMWLFSKSTGRAWSKQMLSCSVEQPGLKQILPTSSLRFRSWNNPGAAGNFLQEALKGQRRFSSEEKTRCLLRRWKRSWEMIDHWAWLQYLDWSHPLENPLWAPRQHLSRGRWPTSVGNATLQASTD